MRPTARIREFILRGTILYKNPITGITQIPDIDDRYPSHRVRSRSFFFVPVLSPQTWVMKKVNRALKILSARASVSPTYFLLIHNSYIASRMQTIFRVAPLTSERAERLLYSLPPARKYVAVKETRSRRNEFDSSRFSKLLVHEKNLPLLYVFFFRAGLYFHGGINALFIYYFHSFGFFSGCVTKIPRQLKIRKKYLNFRSMLLF